MNNKFKIAVLFLGVAAGWLGAKLDGVDGGDQGWHREEKQPAVEKAVEKLDNDISHKFNWLVKEKEDGTLIPTEFTPNQIKALQVLAVKFEGLENIRSGKFLTFWGKLAFSEEKREGGNSQKINSVNPGFRGFATHAFIQGTKSTNKPYSAWFVDRGWDRASLNALQKGLKELILEGNKEVTNEKWQADKVLKVINELATMKVVQEMPLKIPQRTLDEESGGFRFERFGFSGPQDHTFIDYLKKNIEKDSKILKILSQLLSPDPWNKFVTWVRKLFKNKVAPEPPFTGITEAL